MDEVPEITDLPNAKSIQALEGHVEADNIWFSYDSGQPVLKGISFRAKAGETIALVGPSGAGKTTLLNLLPRFYEPEQGTIRMDHTDIKEFKVKSLREQISIVPQEVHLFGTSIKENIRYDSWMRPTKRSFRPQKMQTLTNSSCRSLKGM